MCMLIVYGVSMMLTGSRRLTRLVSTLMDVSRLEAGRLKGSFRLVNLGLVTRDLAVSLLFDNIDQS
jgi:signal transduction histidine kinase